MSKLEKIPDQILRGGSDQNIAFADLIFCLRASVLNSGSKAATICSARMAS
jgi:hypothetical protein